MYISCYLGKIYLSLLIHLISSTNPFNLSHTVTNSHYVSQSLIYSIIFIYPLISIESVNLPLNLYPSLYLPITILTSFSSHFLNNLQYLSQSLILTIPNYNIHLRLFLTRSHYLSQFLILIIGYLNYNIHFLLHSVSNLFSLSQSVPHFHYCSLKFQ